MIWIKHWQMHEVVTCEVKTLCIKLKVTTTCKVVTCLSLVIIPKFIFHALIVAVSVVYLWNLTSALLRSTWTLVVRLSMKPVSDSITYIRYFNAFVILNHWVTPKMNCNRQNMLFGNDSQINFLNFYRNEKSDLADIINFAKFHLNQSRGFGMANVWKSLVPTGKWSRS
jgi:hypothetical protein